MYTFYSFNLEVSIILNLCITTLARKKKRLLIEVSKNLYEQKENGRSSTTQTLVYTTFFRVKSRLFFVKYKVLTVYNSFVYFVLFFLCLLILVCTSWLLQCTKFISVRHHHHHRKWQLFIIHNMYFLFILNLHLCFNYFMHLNIVFQNHNHFFSCCCCSLFLFLHKHKNENNTNEKFKISLYSAKELVESLR